MWAHTRLFFPSIPPSLRCLIFLNSWERGASPIRKKKTKKRFDRYPAKDFVFLEKKTRCRWIRKTPERRGRRAVLKAEVVAAVDLEGNLRANQVPGNPAFNLSFFFFLKRKTSEQTTNQTHSVVLMNVATRLRRAARPLKLGGISRLPEAPPARLLVCLLLFFVKFYFIYFFAQWCNLLQEQDSHKTTHWSCRNWSNFL